MAESLSKSTPGVSEAPTAGSAELTVASRRVSDDLCQAELSVPGVRCGGCIRKIEDALGKLHGVESARVNLSTKRLTVLWRADGNVPPILETLSDLGFEAHINDLEPEGKDKTLSALIRALAVAGFAAGNIMLLSVAIWSGAEDHMRQVFHWISAAIAFPALLYAGWPFFISAIGALKHGRTNMDVPISIGVLLAFGLSLYDTIHHGEEAYFEASVMLLFFLLIGRTLDHVMREKARAAVKDLARLAPRVARILKDDGSEETIPVSHITPGMSVLVAAGERIPVDGEVIKGVSEIDNSLVTGESLPQAVEAGSQLPAGTLNLLSPITITATSSETESFLAEMLRLMEEAESDRSTYRRIADRAARLYAPVVHGAALLTFVAWAALTSDLHHAITVAIAVLIITCPCALGLAVPMVQVVAARRLFEKGVMVKDGSALERLREIDTVVFDKTGTLTEGKPQLLNGPAINPEYLAIAAGMARHSRHPFSRAIAATSNAGFDFDTLAEIAGCGLEAVQGDNVYRLGQASWALNRNHQQSGPAAKANTVLSKNGVLLDVFFFVDMLRPDIQETVDALKARGLDVHILSGDGEEPVKRLANELDVQNAHAQIRPQDKRAYLNSLAASGHKALMVGDGLNDAPALASAHVSMAPSSAADVGRNAADFVFMHDSLEAIPYAIEMADRAGQLIRQNFGLAILYNAVALPFAVLGFVTPLIAAAAMSASSIVVVANALRLGVVRSQRRRKAPVLQPEAAE